MGRKLARGGVHSNLDLAPISLKDRREIEKAEYATSIIDEAKNEARKNEGGEFFSIYGGWEKDQVESKITKAYENLRDNGRAAKPLNMILPDPDSPFGFTWVLTERDAERVSQGYLCPHCLQCQRHIGKSQCEWETQKSDTKGCGWNRIAERFIKESA